MQVYNVYIACSECVNGFSIAFNLFSVWPPIKTFHKIGKSQLEIFWSKLISFLRRFDQNRAGPGQEYTVGVPRRVTEGWKFSIFGTSWDSVCFVIQINEKVRLARFYSNKTMKRQMNEHLMAGSLWTSNFVRVRACATFGVIGYSKPVTVQPNHVFHGQWQQKQNAHKNERIKHGRWISKLKQVRTR